MPLFGAAKVSLAFASDRLWQVVIGFPEAASTVETFDQVKRVMDSRFGKAEPSGTGLDHAFALWLHDPSFLSLRLAVGEGSAASLVLRHDVQIFAPSSYRPPGAPEPVEDTPTPTSSTKPVKSFKSANVAVTVWDTSLIHEEERYTGKRVRLCLHFQNNTATRLIGAVTKTEIRNVFGKVVFQRVHENEVVVAPGE